MTITISKITRAGQITLPKRIRMSKAFAGVQAVVFEDSGDQLIVKPLKSPKKQEFARDHLPFVEYTMRDWLDPVNDDLFKIPKDL